MFPKNGKQGGPKERESVDENSFILFFPKHSKGQKHLSPGG